MEIIESNKFGALNIKDLEDFENHNKIRLPEDYRNFLIQHNGGLPIKNEILSTAIKWLFGMHHEPSWASLFNAIDVYHRRIPSWYMPIGRDIAGNLFIMSLYEGNYGLICFWSHEEETLGDADQFFDNLTTIADSFTEFMDLLE